MADLTTKTFLSLNDNCLVYIFENLELHDLINLAGTCSRMLDIARVSAWKYREQFKVVNVCFVTNYYNTVCDPYNVMTMEHFINVLSLVGEHIFSIKVCSRNKFVLDTIRHNCKNLNNMELWHCERFPNGMEPWDCEISFPLPSLRSINAGNMSPWLNIVECEKYYLNNPDMKMGWHSDYLNELLETSPKLNSIWFKYQLSCLDRNQLFHRLDGLTRFSFKGSMNYDKLLYQLAENLNLIELEFTMLINPDTFDIIEYFRNLEVLSITAVLPYHYFPPTTVYPPKIKCIKFANICITDSDLLYIIKQNKYLEDFFAAKCEICERKIYIKIVSCYVIYCFFHCIIAYRLSPIWFRFGESF